MVPFLFRCPATGMMVQALRPDEAPDDDAAGSYLSIECLACRRIHLVNPATGEVAGADEDQAGLSSTR